jgi:glycosyltransferase involved in cell wall biosynthesis
MAEDYRPVTRVLLVASRMEPRGTSEYTFNLARRLRAAGVEVALSCAPGPMLNLVRQARIPVRTFAHLDNLRLRLGEKRAFLGAVRAFEPQLVHGQTFRVAGALELLARRTELPLVLTVHWVPKQRRRLRALARRMAGIIATSQAAREGLVNQCGVPRGKLSVIPNGIDIARVEARDVPPVFRSPVPVVGSLGPVERERGHELFVKAASVLVGRGLAGQFVVAGRGSALGELRALVGRLGLERCVTLASDFAAYEDVLDAIDVVVQSSQVDVSGLSILEAMGHGRPVIAFNTGTACEIIEDRKTGLLVPKGDVEALADAIQQLITDVEAARRMGEEARRAVKKRFNVRIVGRETLLYYAAILNA